MFEIEEADSTSLPAPGAIHRQGHPVGQVFVDLLVAGHADGIDVLQIKNDPFRLCAVHPLV